MLESGANGVTLFGTTGEGASIGFDERARTIAAMIDSGVSPDVMTIGLCASAVADTLAQVQQAVSFGITDFLLLPPFYFKDPGDAALFDWHKSVFDAAPPQARFILYHIPQVTQVPLSPKLVARLFEAFPDRIIALKDSAGQWDFTRTLLESRTIPVLVGDERLLHKAAALGGAGSICGMANIYPRRMQTLFETQAEDAALSADVDFIVAHPVIPALKTALMAQSGDPGWTTMRPPLRALSGADREAFQARFGT